jgi:hypothetical protein
VHDVFQRPAARDNAGNNVDILLNVHDVIWYLHCFQHYLLLQVPETRHAHLIRYLHCFKHYLLLQVPETRHAHFSRYHIKCTWRVSETCSKR